jgi:hypothetical protein
LFLTLAGCHGIAPAAAAQDKPAGLKTSHTPAKTPRDPALRDELLRRLRADQDVRARWTKDVRDRESVAGMAAVDRENTARMRQILRVYGWPSRDLVGKEGVHAAFLLVQHADADRDFQMQCLPLLRKAAGRGEVPSEAVAMLTDRLLVAQGKRQRYGTQFIKNGAGEWVPLPIEDEGRVDARRKRMGMAPLAEYAKRLREFHRPSTKPSATPAGPGAEP